MTRVASIAPNDGNAGRHWPIGLMAVGLDLLVATKLYEARFTSRGSKDEICCPDSTGHIQDLDKYRAAGSMWRRKMPGTGLPSISWRIVAQQPIRHRLRDRYRRTVTIADDPTAGRWWRHAGGTSGAKCASAAWRKPAISSWLAPAAAAVAAHAATEPAPSS
jgi:hypothetical protein